ncbi:uncharacterized protein [Elaeis guineensis]|uniref:Uncharacterized protein LOC105043714 n=1 Tax=Elaeis guineensis var. tenera TaxID=51953 RepID=A0A6I9R9H3_ELAGV|nr:uncharacterized protein LOC105043714 [Elaeis guineensis]
MAASLPPSFYGLRRLTPRSKVRLALQTRAQNSANEGNSSISIVDANMGVLKKRMEKLRMQERLQRRCKDGEGWYYHKQYDCSLKRSAKLSETLEVAELVAGTFGLTILSCTFCLCLVSLMAHLGR